MEQASERRKVLVTGAAGLIGGLVSERLRGRGHWVRGFDLNPSDEVDESMEGDLADREAVDRAMAGVDTLVHLGAKPSDGPFMETLLQPNVVGLYQVMDAAREAGLRRVVLASSVQVIFGHAPPQRPIRVEDGPAPTNHYALSKVWAEQMGEMYARCHGLSVISARIGWMVRNPKGADALHRDPEGPRYYLSGRDVARFFTCAVEAEGVDHAILFALGPGTGRPWGELEPARRSIGYQPQDDFPAGLPFEWSPPE